MEYDGGLTEEEAEQGAYEEIMEQLENQPTFNWMIFNKHYLRTLQ